MPRRWASRSPVFSRAPSTFGAPRRRASGAAFSQLRGVGRARSVRRHSSAAGLRRAIGAASLRELFAAHSVDQKPLSSTLGTALSSPNGSQRRSVHRGQASLCDWCRVFGFRDHVCRELCALGRSSGLLFRTKPMLCRLGLSPGGHCACSGIEAAIRRCKISVACDQLDHDCVHRRLRRAAGQAPGSGG